MRPEAVPLLVVALLLITAQPGVESISTVVDGDQRIETGADAVVVLDGNATVAAGTTVDASVYVLGGTVRIDGTVDGGVTQMAGEVTASSSARVTGSYDVYGGTQTVADGADVPVEVIAEPFTQERSPAEAVGLFVLQALGLVVAGFVVGRRYDALLANVGHSIRHHPVVSVTVGLLATVTLLALFVFMAFTIVLIPVTVLGLVAGMVVYLYAYTCLGYVIGRRLRPDRPGLATAAGSVLFLAASELLGFVPVVGGFVPLLVLVTAAGAVVITYFGLREFHPPTLAAVGD